MTVPRFSIAMPVHNGANYLVEALESVCAQSFSDFELTISDNASSDATPEILSNYSRKDSRIRFSRSETLIPVTENFNRAGSLARGQWMLFLSHDDVLRPNCLECLETAICRFDSQQFALVGFGQEYLFANGYLASPKSNKSAMLRYYPGRQFLKLTLQGQAPDGLPGSGNSVIRRQVWEQFGRFDPRFLHCDLFLWHRILVRHDYLVVAEPLLRRRIHEHQDSANIRRSGRSIHEYRTFFPEFLREHQDELGLSRRVIALAERRYVSVAATEIAIQLAKRSPRKALQILRLVPWRLYPFLAGLVLRNSYREAMRTREIRRHVPIKILYPD